MTLPASRSTLPPGSRIAIVGGGISGLASAWLLAKRHRVTLFEANDYIGGHTNTVDVQLEGLSHPVDTGFLVFNDKTYPNLIALLAELGVPTHTSDMSFGVSMDGGRLEWAGSNLATVFAQKRNLVSPRFLSMLRDILRFNAAAEANLVRVVADGSTLGELLDAEGYGLPFRNNYLLPMAAAIWSSSPADILRFPAATFLRFCLNHALLQVRNRPTWRTVLGGGREYVQRIVATLPDVRSKAKVRAVIRNAAGVAVSTSQDTEQFDAVVMASHAPQTLAMLVDADEREHALLGSVRYQGNLAILHTDTALLPRRQSVWSAWNYLSETDNDGAGAVCVSYLINRLQPLPFKTPVIVTLNPIKPVRPQFELARFSYQHPVFDQAAITAQNALPHLQGSRNTWFAGAWTGYGFHEDGLKSALRVAADFDCLPQWAVL